MSRMMPLKIERPPLSGLAVTCAVEPVPVCPRNIQSVSAEDNVHVAAKLGDPRLRMKNPFQDMRAHRQWTNPPESRAEAKLDREVLTRVT